MTARARRRVRLVVAVGSVVTAVVLVGLAICLGRQDLDHADKIASVLGVLLNTVAVAVAVAGLGLSWWMGRTPQPHRVRQSIRADDRARIDARRAQRASPGGGGSVHQEITGRGDSEIGAAGAQSVGPDDD